MSCNTNIREKVVGDGGLQCPQCTVNIDVWIPQENLRVS